MESVNWPITSICVYNRTDEKGNIYYLRLFDIRNNQIFPVEYDISLPRSFENRKYIIFNNENNPGDELVVLKWTAVPNLDDPDRDFVKAEKTLHYTFYQLKKFNSNITKEEAVSHLKQNNLRLPTGNYLFQYMDDSDFSYAVLCTQDDLIFDSKYTKLKPTVFVLKNYELPKADILEYSLNENKKYRVYRKLSLPFHIDKISVKELFPVIKEKVLQRISWKKYKDVTGGTRKQFQQFKELLDEVTDSSLIEELVTLTGHKESEIIETLQLFEHQAQDIFVSSDFDDSIINAIFLENPEFQERFLGIAKEEWESKHSENVNSAKDDLNQIEKKITESKKLSETLEKEIEKKQAKILSLEQEVIAAEELTKNSSEKALKTIEQAKADITGFLSQYMINSWIYSPQGSPSPQKTSITFHQGDPIYSPSETYDDYTSLLQDLSDNLKDAGVGDAYQKGLAAYLYGAYLHFTDILLAGPNGEAIANAVSLCVQGRTADVLSLRGEYSESVISQALNTDSKVLIVKNLFKSDNLSEIVQRLSDSSKMIIYIHPYHEDLVIEPYSLLNYLVPLITEPLIEYEPVDFTICGTLSEYFNHVPETNRPTNVYRSFMDSVSLSPLAINKMIQLINTIHTCTGKKESDKDPNIDILLVLYPIAYMTDSLAILETVISESKEGQYPLDRKIRKYLEAKLNKAGITVSE